MLVSPPATSVATAQAPQRQLYQVGPASDDDLIYATSIRVTQARRNGCEVCPALSSDSQPPSCHQLAKTAPKTETARLNFGPGPLEGLSHSGPCRSLRSRTTKASQNNFTLASNLHRRRRPTRSRRSLWIPPSRTARPWGGRNSCPTRPRPRPPRTATPRRDRRAAPAPGTKWPIQFPLFFERRPTLPRCCFLASDRSPRLVSASFFLVVISRFVGVVAWLASLAGFALFPLDFFSRFLVVGSVACLLPTCPPERLFDRLGLKLGVVVVRTRHWTSCRPGPRQQRKLRSAANRLTPSARLVTTLLCDCARCCCAHKY